MTLSRFVALLFALGIPSSAWAVPTAPSPVPGGIEPGADVRAFFTQGDVSYLAELNAIYQTNDRHFVSGTVGAYDRLIENLKVGAFFSRAYGLRHDEDWFSTNGQWGWTNTNGRGENLLIGDVSPVATLDFLPGKNWVGEFKTRYIYDTFDAQQTLMVRPGLRYFWLRDDRPFVSLFFQVQANFPLNYGVKTIYEKWFYAGALYRIAGQIDLGGFVATKWETWGNTQDFIDRGGAPYAITTQTWDLTAVMILQL